MSIIDFYSLQLDDHPAEWRTVAPEVLEFMQAKRGGIYSPIQRRILDKIASERWFFVRNELRAPSRNWDGSRRVDAYLTMGGIELPFNGLADLILVIQSYSEREQAQLISAMRPGTIEPITEERAKRNIARIRATGRMIYPNVDVD